MTPSKLRFGILLGLISLFLVGVGHSKPLSSQEILDLLNADRITHGLSELSLNETLSMAASAKAHDMLEKKYFSHIGPDGTSPWHWFKVLGYNYAYAGENLAEGYDNASDLETSWMGSPTHRANILSPFYSDVGVAIVERDGTSLVVQFFGSVENKLTLRQ